MLSNPATFITLAGIAIVLPAAVFSVIIYLIEKRAAGKDGTPRSRRGKRR